MKLIGKDIDRDKRENRLRTRKCVDPSSAQRSDLGVNDVRFVLRKVEILRIDKFGDRLLLMIKREERVRQNIAVSIALLWLLTVSEVNHAMIKRISVFTSRDCYFKDTNHGTISFCGSGFAF